MALHDYRDNPIPGRLKKTWVFRIYLSNRAGYQNHCRNKKMFYNNPVIQITDSL